MKRDCGSGICTGEQVALPLRRKFLVGQGETVEGETTFT